MKRPIVMAHGAFCGGWAFRRFRRPFEAAGHKVTAPDLPGHEDLPHRQPVAGLSMADYAQALARVIAAQESPPVVIGHSLGGLVAQLAAARAPVSGLILLAPSAPWGVAASSPEEAASAMSLYVLGPLWPMTAVDPSKDLARRYLVDRLPREGRRWVYERLRPESGRALFETLNWWLDPFATTLVPPHSIRAPVLGIAGGADAIHPVATVQATVSRLGGSLIVAKGASHWLPGEPGWEDVADECLDWIEGLETRAAA
ncbi:MAG TPA: alpha/beta hydrolase [Caulobacteraceae bacterium]|nr:alpha/beta hydrolase [Caulobacteraceae bacterium]